MNKSQVIGMIKSLSGSSGGASSWNDLQDKPFGEVYCDTLTWDGTIGSDNTLCGVFVHISDAVPTAEELKNGMLLDWGEGEVAISGEEIAEFVTNDGFLNLDEIFIIVPRDNYDYDGAFTFQNAGIYSLIGLPYMTVTIPGYTKFVTLKKIDPKYIQSNCAVLYVGLDQDGKNRVYTDENHTVGLSEFEMFQIINRKIPIIVSNANNEIHFVTYAHTARIGYVSVSVNGATENLVAYTFNE